ncbi:MAG TPA: ABC transporter substrate-binding protein [Streptosporangiaceae bacterium]
MKPDEKALKTAAKRRAVVVCVAASLFLAACGSSASAGSSADATTAITVGTSPAILNVSLYYAAQSGLFTKNGLKETPKVLASGEEATPLLLNGQIQFAANDPVGVITAISKNVPVVFVAAAGYPSTDPSKDITGLLVKSSIKSAADLNGKTIAVNALGGNLELAAKAAIDKAGGDSASMKFVVMSLPSMDAAVKSGKVAGAVASEPFIAAGKAEGLSDLLSVASTAEPGVPTVVYMTSKAYASSHPDVVRKFIASLNASDSALSKSPATVRSVAVKSTGAPASLLAKSNLPVFKSAAVPLSALDELQNLMIKYKFLAKKVDLSKYIASGS